MGDDLKTALVAFGGNLGNVRATWRLALVAIGERIGVVRKQSPLYETLALTLDGSSQPNYLNAVLEVETVLEPERILAELLDIERTLGRDRSSSDRWAPRPIDLDLLFVDGVVMKSATLTLPHAELHKRDFVLRPLADIAPEFQHPVLHSSVETLLAALNEGFVLGKVDEARSE